MNFNSLRSISDFVDNSHIEVMCWGSARVYSNTKKEYIRLKEIARQTGEIAERLIWNREFINKTLTQDEKSMCNSIHAKLMCFNDELERTKENAGIILKIFIILREYFYWDVPEDIYIDGIPTFKN